MPPPPWAPTTPVAHPCISQAPSDPQVCRYLEGRVTGPGPALPCCGIFGHLVVEYSPSWRRGGGLPLRKYIPIAKLPPPLFRSARCCVLFDHSRDLILGDDALLYIAYGYVMLIWAAPIPATRCHCSHS